MPLVLDKQIQYTTLLNANFEADAIATANVATLTGLAATLDGVALNTDGMKAFLTAQTTGAQNGPWIVHAGAWTRPTNYNTGANFPGTTVFLKSGIVHAGEGWIANNASPSVIDTDASVWVGFSFMASRARALAQPAWFISFLTGNDNNSGIVVGSPLKTYAELVRRWGTIAPVHTTPAVVITIIDHNISDLITYKHLVQTPTGHLRTTFQPLATAVLQSGSYTATRPKVTATNTPPGLTDTAIPGGVWPIGRRVKVTNGPANGAFYWILKDEGAQVSRDTNATITGLAVVQPLVTNTYNVETLTDLFVDALTQDGWFDYNAGFTLQAQLIVSDFNTREGSFLGIKIVNDGSAEVVLNRCSFEALNIENSTRINFFNCMLSPQGAGTSQSFGLSQSVITIENGGGIGIGSQGITAINGSTILSGSTTGGYIGQNRPIILYMGSRGSGMEYACMDCATNSLNTGGDGLLIGSGAFIGLPAGAIWSIRPNGRLWGAGNVGRGIGLASNSLIIYALPADAPTITGAGGDWRSAGGASTQQSLGYNGATMIAEGPFANTWANLNTASPTGFGGCAFDIRTGARIALSSRDFT